MPFSVQGAGCATEDWQVEAQCPSCDGWACFTVADTLELPRPDPRELEAATQKLGEQLYQPITEHRSHPAVAWMDRVGNGFFKDDCTSLPVAIPTPVYRFTRGDTAAYIWQEGVCWLVRPWHSLQSRREPPDPVEVFSFEQALDRLLE